eukprot:TRINITY_DN77154_c0_g1_i1.p1 TRINITY_DN77154_c0_g1~~TRINITY_DN77154_c0_g1_i1.p1  ORF type:complete len:148 (-),score=25.16 TRINITY_DN77154_c0_g1_i1:91-534(-)
MTMDAVFATCRELSKEKKEANMRFIFFTPEVKKVADCSMGTIQPILKRTGRGKALAVARGQKLSGHRCPCILSFLPVVCCGSTYPIKGPLVCEIDGETYIFVVTGSLSSKVDHYICEEALKRHNITYREFLEKPIGIVAEAWEATAS